MICSKCQLPTDEADLVDTVCGPCRGEVSCGGTETKLLNPSEFGKMMAKARAEYKYDGPLTAGQAFYRNTEPMKTDPFVAAALREAEGLPEVLGPVVSPQSNYRPGRTVYSVQYRYEDGRKGFMDFSDVVRVERMVRIVVQDGGEVVSVSEAREMVNDEPGLPVELLAIGQWSRERIQQAIRLYPDVKREIKNKATKAYYGKTETIVTGVTSFKREYGEAFLAGEEAAKKSLRSSSASPNFANIRNKESVEEHLDKRCRELRRVKAFGVDRNRVLDFLTKGCRYATEDIPADVEILEVHEDPMRRMFVFTLRHDSFPPVPEGQVLEMIRPVWEVDTSDRDLLGDMLNLVERAVQIHSQHLEPEIAEEYFKRAQEVCQRLHGKGLK